MSSDRGGGCGGECKTATVTETEPATSLSYEVQNRKIVRELGVEYLGWKILDET